MQNIGTLISATIRPNDTLDPIASAFSNEIKGGHHSYATISERNSIILQRRDWGMLVTIFNDTITSNNKTYQLVRGFSSINIMDNNNWVVFNTGSGSGSSSSNSWIDSVNDILDTPPISPNDGDRYLVSSTPSGIWFDKSNRVVTWNSSLNTWLYYIPEDGDMVVVKDENNCVFRYGFSVNINGSWIRQIFGGIPIKTYISNETIEVPINTQYFVYGDLTIDSGGNLINNGQVITLNGNIIILDDGVFTNYGEYISPIATNLNEVVTYSKFTTNINVISNIPYDIVHNLDSEDIVVSVYNNGSLYNIDVLIVDLNTITITSPISALLKVNIIS